MPAAGKVVHEFQSKLRTIANSCAEIGKIRNGSVRSLAKELGIPVSTLTSCYPFGTVTADIETKLANFVGFSIADPAWVDITVLPAVRQGSDSDDYRGRDTAKAFTKLVRDCLGLGAVMQVRIEGQTPDLLDGNLVTFEIDDAGQATDFGRALQLFLSIVISRGLDLTGVRFGFTRLRLRFRPQSESSFALVDRLAESGDVEIRNAMLKLEGKGKTTKWELIAQSGVLDGEYVTAERALCQVIGLELNEIIVAEVAVNLFERGSVIVETPVPTQQTEKHIIKQLMIKEIPGNTDSQGWKTLGLQRLKCVRR